MKTFAKRPAFVLLEIALTVFPFMVSCSDYEEMIDEDYEEWEVLHLGGDEESSSSDSLMSSSSEESDDPVPDDSLSSGADSDKKSSSSSVPADSDTTKSPAAGYDASAGTLTDARDMRVYKTIVVGTGADARVWMAENLNYNYNRGTASSICYENKTENCETDGRIYLWSAAVDSAAAFSKEADGCGRGKKCTMADVVRGACPEGWHLPNKTELEELIAFAGGKSKSADSVRKAFKNNGKSTNIWSSAQHNVLYAFNMSLFDGEKVAKVDSVDKKKSFSVRCILNYDLPQDTLSSSSTEISSSSAYVPIDSSVLDAEANTLVDLRDNVRHDLLELLRLLRLSAAFVQPRPYVCFGVAFTQTVQSDKAIRPGRLDCRVRYIGTAFDRIATLLQSIIKGLHGKGFGKRGVYVLTDQTAHGGPSLLFGVPFCIMLSCSFRLDNGKIVFSADLIGYSPNISVVRLEVVPVHLSVNAGNRVENDMRVNMVVVNVRCDHCLKTPLQKPLGKFHAETVSLLRCYFAGRKRMNDVIALYGAVFLIPAAFGVHHVRICCIKPTVNGRPEDLTVFCPLCFAFVQRVVDALIQPGMNNNDLIIGHFLQAPMLSLPAQRRQRSLPHGCSFAH